MIVQKGLRFDQMSWPLLKGGALWVNVEIQKTRVSKVAVYSSYSCRT